MIAIIPARGGSKGLPGKNTKLLNGKPLIAYTLESALDSKCIHRIFINTDSPEISDIAMEYGAECPFLRPDYLAQDDSLAIDVYLHALDKLEREFSTICDDFCVLQPTSPLRSATDIDSAIDLFHRKDADSVLSYTEEYHPVFWHHFIEDDGRLKPLFKTASRNRQDERTTYYPNGAIYVLKKKLLLKRTYHSEKTYAYKMPRSRSVDIDTIDDFRYAEFLMNG